MGLSKAISSLVGAINNYRFSCPLSDGLEGQLNPNDCKFKHRQNALITDPTSG